MIQTLSTHWQKQMRKWDQPATHLAPASLFGYNKVRSLEGSSLKDGTDNVSLKTCFCISCLHLLLKKVLHGSVNECGIHILLWFLETCSSLFHVACGKGTAYGHFPHRTKRSPALLWLRLPGLGLLDILKYPPWQWEAHTNQQTVRCQD